MRVLNRSVARRTSTLGVRVSVISRAPLSFSELVGYIIKHSGCVIYSEVGSNHGERAVAGRAGGSGLARAAVDADAPDWPLGRRRGLHLRPVLRRLRRA